MKGEGGGEGNVNGISQFNRNFSIFGSLEKGRKVRIKRLRGGPRTTTCGMGGCRGSLTWKQKES